MGAGAYWGKLAREARMRGGTRHFREVTPAEKRRREAIEKRLREAGSRPASGTGSVSGQHTKREIKYAGAFQGSCSPKKTLQNATTGPLRTPAPRSRHLIIGVREAFLAGRCAPVHQEDGSLTVPYFPFRVLTPL